MRILRKFTYQLLNYINAAMIRIAIILLFCWVLNSSAQVPGSERLIGMEQGLSNSSVSTIFQDGSGFMWMGTHDGLDKYNGYDFNVYRHQFNQPSSIDGNWIVCINGDQRGRIWIGTRNGLNIYEPILDSFKHISYYEGNIVRPLHSNISDIKIDGFGNVFIATTNYGLLVCSKDSLIARKIPLSTVKFPQKYNYPTSAIAISNNDVWVTARNIGLLQYDYNSNSLRLIKQVPNNNALVMDLQKHIWLGTDDGLYKYADNQLKLIYASHNRVVNLSVDHQKLWIASDGDGVLTKSVQDNDPPVELVLRYKKEDGLSKSIFSIYHDKDGRMWIGTLRSGVVSFDLPVSGLLSFRHDPEVARYQGAI